MNKQILMVVVFAATTFFAGCDVIFKGKAVPEHEKAKVVNRKVVHHTSKLFIIERNKNANIVRYDLNIGHDGKIVPGLPVKAYWVMLAEDGRKKELNHFSKKAYGFECTHTDDPEIYNFEIKAFKKREMKVFSEEGVARAEITIDGQKTYLEKIFITSRSVFGIPRVKSLELYGKDIKTGKELHEKIKA